VDGGIERELIITNGANLTVDIQIYIYIYRIFCSFQKREIKKGQRIKSQQDSSRKKKEGVHCRTHPPKENKKKRERESERRERGTLHRSRLIFHTKTKERQQRY